MSNANNQILVVVPATGDGVPIAGDETVEDRGGVGKVKIGGWRGTFGVERGVNQS